MLVISISAEFKLPFFNFILEFLNSKLFLKVSLYCNMTDITADLCSIP